MSGLFRTMFHKAGSAAKTALALVGLVSVGKAYSDYAALNVKADSNKRRVLEMDFDKIDLVERKKDSLAGFAAAPGSDRITMEVRELIDVLHHAAADDSIAGIFGKFNWMSLNSVGWADLEELRNALLVVQQSHRRHPEPNVRFDKIVIPPVSKKFLYCYADSFGSMADPSNKSYYVATAFADVHLQEHGELSLFGNLSAVYFIRELLETYHINVHVFKQGVYKNAPDMFTHYKMNKFHQQQVQALHDSIQQDVNDDIVQARSKALSTSWLKDHNKDWTHIHNAGIFPAAAAWKAGLVDYLPRRDPLNDLVEHGKSSADPPPPPSAWNSQETDFKKFTAESKVTLADYAKQLKRHQQASKKLDRLKKLVHEYSFLQPVASTLGWEDPSASDTIAVLQVNGMIGDKEADSVMESLQGIKKNPPKALVLRVNSRGGSILACEKIQQELQALDVPLVVSLGNYSASGGYYIATPAERIFGSRKTITGSIGVFGIRLDLTGLAAKYGINVQHIASSDLSATYSPLAPMSRKMKETFSQQVDRSYDRFKAVVAEGRNLDLETVERLAKGQVYTGKVAKHNGLMDEIGGLHRAIAYAKRNYAETADIEVYPKEKTLLQKLSEMKNSSEVMSFLQSLVSGSVLSQASSHDALVQRLLQGGIASSGIFYAADENGAVDCLLSTSNQPVRPVGLPKWFWDE